MRLLTVSELLEYADTKLSEHSIAQELLEPFLPIGAEKGYLVYAVNEGLFQATTLTIDNIPSYVIYYHVTLDKTFVVNLTAQLRDYRNISALFVGCEKLARQNGCTTIAFHTNRKGRIKTAYLYGYKPIAILFRKTID